MKSIFEEEFREYPDDSEPLWSFDWGDSLLIGLLVLWGAAMLIKFI